VIILSSAQVSLLPTCWTMEFVHSTDVLNVFLRFLFRPLFQICKKAVKSKVWLCENPARNSLRGCLRNDVLL